MAAGCVVIVSEFAGAHEVVSTAASGFVFAGVGDAAEIATLIDGPLSDARKRDEIGRAALGVARSFDRATFYGRVRAAHHRPYERRLERKPRLAR